MTLSHLPSHNLDWVEYMALTLSSGDSEIHEGIADKRLVLLALAIFVEADCQCTIKSSGNSLSSPMRLRSTAKSLIATQTHGPQNGAIVLPYSPVGWAQADQAKDLTLTLTADGNGLCVLGYW